MGVVGNYFHDRRGGPVLGRRRRRRYRVARRTERLAQAAAERRHRETLDVLRKRQG